VLTLYEVTGTWPYVYDNCDVRQVSVPVTAAPQLISVLLILRLLSLSSTFQVGTLQNQSNNGVPSFTSDEGDIYNNGKHSSPFFRPRRD
jgi:hypothetical protein